MKTISREDIIKNMKQNIGMILIEALPAEYYSKEHLPGAINIPHDQISKMAPELLRNKDAFIVTYCASTACPNSKIAASALENLGYTNVYEYVEGKQDWVEAGFEME